MLNSTEYLDKVIDIVQKGWIKGTYAKDSRRHQTAVMDADACSFCLEGALARAADGWEHLDNYREIESDIYTIVAKKFPDRGPHAECQSVLPAFNDHDNTTVDDVITVLEEAKKRIQQEQSDV